MSAFSNDVIDTNTRSSPHFVRLPTPNSPVIVSVTSMSQNPLHISNLFDLNGKVAVVTGGSRGIGRMIATGLVENGVRTYITSRNEQECEETARFLSKSGHCIAIPADLSTTAGVAHFVAGFNKHEEHLDILVNNAGAVWVSSIEDFPEAGFDKVMSINIKAPFFLTQALLPQLKKNATSEEPARVIMIGSIDGIRTSFMTNYSYSASKAGLHMMARHLAAHLVNSHININSIAPGPFESKMMAAMLASEENRKIVTDSVPMNRIGTPKDIAGAVIFLASRAGSYVTGATLAVDGGASTI